MGIYGESSYYAEDNAIQNQNRSVGRNSSVSNNETIGNATSLSESSDNGKRIGITTVGNIGYIAMYADSSTEQDPIVKVGDYEVRVKDVNPNNATKMEMFALMSYMDDKGLTNNQGMKSFNKMTAYSAQAEYNGYCSGISDESAAWTVERDWIGILGSAKETFLGNSQTYEQGLECQKLMGNLQKWNQVRSYSDTDAIDNIQNIAQMIPIQSGEEGVARLEHGLKKIVRTVDPEDGKEYVTYFTKHSICCKWMEGDNEVSWTMDITEEQYALIDKYFDGYNSGNKEEQLWYSGDEFSMVSSKEYWLGFFEGAEVSDENYMEAIREQIEEMQEKIENGEINETFQIGNQTFTVEEWNEFLEKFDSIQEVLEALMKERHAEMEKQQSVKKEDVVEQNALDMIISESTSCTYPASDTNGVEIRYITCYTEEGIFCKKAGLTDGYEWSIPFESKEQYDKVMEFIGQLSDDEDLRFTANENFWKDFLKGDTDVESLKEKYTISDSSGVKRTEIKVSNFKEYETPNYQFVPEPDIGTGGMRILKNGQSVAVFSVDDLKIRVDEQTGTRVLISEIGGYNGIWYDAIAVDAELENGLAEAIGVDDIPEVGLEGYYIGTHAGTGIQYVMKPGEEGRGGKVLFRNEADVARYNALAEEYYNRYPNLINSQEEGRIWASFEIVGMAERTDTGIVRIGYDGVSYNDNFDYKKNWSIIFTEATWELLNEWLKDNRERMTEWDKFGSWGDVFDKIGGSYERIWSDEELKQGYLNN